MERKCVTFFSCKKIKLCAPMADHERSSIVYTVYLFIIYTSCIGRPQEFYQEGGMMKSNNKIYIKINFTLYHYEGIR